MVEETVEDEYSTNTLEELEEMLQKAVENEEYEKASRIRDEINKKKERLTYNYNDLIVIGC